MALEEWLVEGNLLDTRHRVLVQMVDSVDQEEWRTMWQHSLDIVDIVERSLASIVLEARFDTLATNRRTELLHKLGVGVVTRAGCHNAALDTHTKQSEVAEQVEQLVACHLVRSTQLEIVEIATRNTNILLVEEQRKSLQLLVGDRILDNHNRIVDITALDQAHCCQSLDLVQEYKGAVWSNLLGVVVLGGKCGVLVADNLRVEVDMYRSGILVARIDGQHHTLLGDGIDLFLGHLIVATLSRLFNQAHAQNLGSILAGRAIHNWRFGSIDVDQGIIDTKSPESRHNVLDSADTRLAFGNGCTTRSVHHIIAQGRHHRCALDIYTTKDYSVILGRRICGHCDLLARMESLTREGN